MPRMLWTRFLILLGIAMLLTACASNPPLGLEPPAADAPTPAQVQASPTSLRGQEVRWGGEILSIENLSRDTEVEIFSRPLFDNAEPRPDGGEGVRFFAVIRGFLDPAQYGPGKRLTVRGRVVDAVRRPVGEYDYLYPVVVASQYHLWPVYVAEPARFRDPYYDPWWPWGPWGPYRPWPYRW